jgi:translation initiation factor eIF-2B subunit delta
LLHIVKPTHEILKAFELLDLGQSSRHDTWFCPTKTIRLTPDWPHSNLERREEQKSHVAMSEGPAAEPTPAPAPAAAVVPPQESTAATTNGDTTDASKKLSPAELKKQKQAEKQAKRAQAKAAGGAPNQQQGPSKDGQKQQRESKQTSKDDKSRPLPVRRRPSQVNTPVLKEPEKKARRDKEPKQTGLFFGHLYSQPKQQSLVGASKDVHPAVLALGLQYSSYAICGSTARMVAMLLVFKTVIEAYQTPPGNSLARHLTSHHLGPQIEFLKSCRPLSISMGNAIRWLKDSKLAFRFILTK